MIINMEINLENMQKAKMEILKLMENPWCDADMYFKLEEKLKKTNAKIEELCKQQ
jgi:hypothetical protein